MRTLFTLLFFTLYVISYAQHEAPCPDDPDDPRDLANLAANGRVSFSSIYNLGTTPSKAVDGDTTTFGRTRFEENPFMTIDLRNVYYIPYLTVKSPDTINQFYVFTSEYPIEDSKSLNELLSTPWITSHQVMNYRSGYKFYIKKAVQYIRVQFNATRSLTVSEFYSPGDPIDDEICNNGIDDNCDGRIDCEDPQCGVFIHNAYSIDASCPICSDGEIDIQAWGENKLFSVDGGITYSNSCFDSYENMCFFKGLPPGHYTVMVKNSVSGCTATWPETIIIGYPPLGPDAECVNGGFEHGNFDNWSGGTASSVAPITFNNTTIDQTDHHFIIPTASFIDQFIPTIDNNFSGLGNYLVRLGRPINDRYFAERLKYCIDVDANTSDLHFAYAYVLQYGHPLNNGNGWVNAQFGWTVYLDDGNPPNQNNIIFPPVTFYADPADTRSTLTQLGPMLPYDPVNLQLVWANWNCQDYDLTPYINRRVCIEFVTAHCSESGHFGYAYIDGLCTELFPNMAVIPHNIYCKDQTVELAVSPGGYDHFKWTISELVNNVPTNTMIYEMDGDDASIDDLLELYNDQTPYEFECGDKIRLELEVSNQCNSNSFTKDIELSCEEYEFDYCNVMIDCLGDQTEQIQGTNSCNDCDITWSNSQNLILNDILFPTVTAENDANAFFETYYINMVTPEGCTYMDSVKFQHYMDFTLKFDTIADYCSYGIKLYVTFEEPFTGSLIEVDLFDDQNDKHFDMDFLENESNDYKKVYYIDLTRDVIRDIEIFVQVYPEEQGCNTGDVCQKLLDIGILKRSKFVDPWWVYLVNVFSPNGDGVNDIWFPGLAGSDVNCQNPSNLTSNVYYAKVEIHDRWGGLMFKKEVTKGVHDSGVWYLDLSWDGKGPNGQYVSPGVYVATIEVHSCYPDEHGPTCSWSWDCDGPTYFCNESSPATFSWDVTVIN